MMTLLCSLTALHDVRIYIDAESDLHVWVTLEVTGPYQNIAFSHLQVCWSHSD